MTESLPCYLKICPRDFQNEWSIYRIETAEELAHARAKFADYEDRWPSGSATIHQSVGRRARLALRYADYYGDEIYG